MQKKTWKSMTGGILSIIAGAVVAIIAVVAVAVAALMAVIPVTPEILGEFGSISGIALITLGIVAIMGSISVLPRRKWGLALAGCICALLCVFPLAPAMTLGYQPSYLWPSESANSE